jgi:hypothetical protein
MAWFQKSTKEANPTPDVIQPDPSAFAPIPPPAPYKPAIYFPADKPVPTTAIQETWPLNVGDEEDVNPKLRRRYAKDTEYLRDLTQGAQDGIGHTHDPYTSKQIQAPDPRWAGVPEDLGKRPVEMVQQDKYTYFRPFEAILRRMFDGSHGSVADIIPGDVRQGNYSNRTWRLTERFDPLAGEPTDRVPAAATSVVSEYTASTGVRRTFRK